MIRFGCPSCDKVYKVPVTLGGKPATCTRCSTRFLIPVPPKPPPTAIEKADDPPPPPRPTPVPARPVPPSVIDVLEAEVVEDVPVPPPAPSQPPPAPAVGGGGGSARPPLVTLEPCPDCAAVQTAPPADLGLWVECASCQTVFLAVEDKAAPPVPPGVTARSLRPPITATGFEASSPPPASSSPPPAEVVEAKVAEPASRDVPIAPCPKCRAELMVAETDVGGNVECPFCQTVYRATPPQPKVGTTLARVVRRNPAPPPAGGKKPYQFRRDDDDRRRKKR